MRGPVSPSSTPYADIQAKGDQLLARLNAVAESAGISASTGASTSYPVPQSARQPPGSRQPFAYTAGQRSAQGGYGMVPHTPTHAVTRREEVESGNIALLQARNRIAVGSTNIASAQSRSVPCVLILCGRFTSPSNNPPAGAAFRCRGSERQARARPWREGRRHCFETRAGKARRILGSSADSVFLHGVAPRRHADGPLTM